MAEKPSVDVAYVANLARIALSDSALARYQAQLDDIVAYIGQLAALDVSGIDPMLYGQAHEPLHRDDAARPGLPVETVMGNAPDRVDACFRVPRIVE